MVVKARDWQNLIIFAIVLSVLLVIFLPSFSRWQDLKQKNKEYEDTIGRLQAHNQALLKECKRLKEDPVYLEKVAREKMGLIREGETIYKIVNE